jgi:DNA processing protein
VAIVGARRASAAGQAVARKIGRDLGRRGVPVVSGFAVGVDAAAHDGAIGWGGSSVGVLGCGLDVDYPRQHRELRQALATSGALVSEYAPADRPAPWRFPHRNRLIAALSRAVIVVEAGVMSGALSTARWAADLGREVLAVPGCILGPANAGSNLLLRDGARPYLDVSDLADLIDVGGDGPAAPGPAKQMGRTAATQVPGSPARRLLALLGAERVQRELLGRDLGMGAAELAVLLGEMELGGSIRCLPGGLVARARW